VDRSFVLLRVDKAVAGDCVRVTLQPVKAAQAADAFSPCEENEENRLVKGIAEKVQVKQPAKNVPFCWTY
jgi:hypothetical protein